MIMDLTSERVSQTQLNVVFIRKKKKETAGHHPGFLQ
jgi:hypothetical protein